jgi:hypothetical protein
VRATPNVHYDHHHPVPLSSPAFSLSLSPPLPYFFPFQLFTNVGCHGYYAHEEHVSPTSVSHTHRRRITLRGQPDLHRVPRALAATSQPRIAGNHTSSDSVQCRSQIARVPRPRLYRSDPPVGQASRRVSDQRPRDFGRGVKVFGGRSRAGPPKFGRSELGEA